MSNSIENDSFGEKALSESKMKREISSSEVLFRGPIFQVSRDYLREPSGKTMMRDVVLHPGGAGGLPIFQDGRVALVKQYRHPAKQELLEIPAGKIEQGESPELTAAREIEQEIGVRVGHLEKVAEFYSTPGFCEEKLYIYLATELMPGKQELDFDEEIEIVYMSLEEALGLVEQGAIEDAKTIIALFWASQRKLKT